MVNVKHRDFMQNVWQNGKGHKADPYWIGSEWAAWGKVENGTETLEISKKYRLFGKGQKRRRNPSYWSSLSKSLGGWWNIFWTSTTCYLDFDSISNIYVMFPKHLLYLY